MAVDPNDIKVPETARQRNRSVRRNDVSNRGKQIKDMGTAKSMRDLANEIKKGASEQVAVADRNQRRSERLTAMQIDSASTISRARTAENDQYAAEASAKAEASFKRRDNSWAAYTQIVADSVGIAGALQEKRKDFEQGLEAADLRIKQAKFLAEELPKVQADLDGTPEKLASANQRVADGLRKIYADARESSPYASDEAHWANLESTQATGALVNVATNLGTHNHNSQVYLAGKEAERIFNEKISYVKSSGDIQGAIEGLAEMDEVLRKGLLNQKEADDLKKAAHAAVIDAAIEFNYESGNHEAVRMILDKAQGTYEGDDPMLNSLTAAMRAEGVPILRAMAIIGAESGLNPKAKNPYGSASGTYQQINDTFRENYRKVYGYDPIKYFPKGVNKNVGMARSFSLEVQAAVGARGLAEHQNTLKHMLGRDYLTDSEAYSAHVLGPRNAHKLLTYPDSAPITSIVSAHTARINPWTKNGRVFTVGEVKKWTHDKMIENKRKVLKKGYVQFDAGWSEYVDTDKVAAWGKTLATKEAEATKAAKQYANDKTTVFSSHSGDKGDKADPVSYVMDKPPVIYAKNELDNVMSTTDEEGNLTATPAEIQAAHKKYGDALTESQNYEYRVTRGTNMPNDWGRVLTEADAAQKANSFRDLDGEAAVQFIRTEATKWGEEYWPVVARQLQKHAGSGDMQVALMFDPVRNPTIHDNMSRIINANPKDMEESLPKDITLNGKYDGLMPIIEDGLADVRDSMVLPHYSAKTRGEAWKAIKNMAGKYAMNHIAMNPGASASDAAQAAIDVFTNNMIAVNQPKARIAMTVDDLERRGLTPDQLERGMAKVVTRDFIDDYLSEEILGVGDPGMSRPLYEPEHMIEQGSLDLGEYLMSGRADEIPQVDLVKSEGGWAVVPKPGDYESAVKDYESGGGFYGVFATQYGAESYARAMRMKAHQMQTFDRTQTIENMINYGQVVEAPGGGGVMITVRTHGSTGRSPVTGITGRPLIIPWDKLGEAADL